MTDYDKAEIRSIVNEVVACHLSALVASSAPLANALADMQRSLGMLIQGQALIEKHFAGVLGKDDEPWRDSLDGADD